MSGQSQDRPASIEDALASTSIADRFESSWLVYLRILGAITTACIAAATVLHQLQCELSSEPTHWLAALGLVALSSASCAALIVGNIASPGFTILANGGCAIVLLLGFFLMELCETHAAFFIVLLCINLAAVLLFLGKGNHFLNRSNRRSAPLLIGGSKASDDGLHASPVGNSGADEARQPLDRVAGYSDEKRVRPFWVRHAGWVLFGIVFVIYMVIVPTIAMVIGWMTPVTSRTLTDMTLLESIRLHTVSGIVMLTFLGMGASIGSFLNVVIYRFPRRLPLLWPPSACANCGTRLRGKDNIPILSWLRLGGRCRYCEAAISIRYPIIEAVVAILFVLFYYRELLSGGANLPVRQPNFYNGVVWILLYTKWDLVTIYLFHMVLLVLLLSWGMINYDRFRVPIHTTTICCAIFVGLASALPHLNPTHAVWEGSLGQIAASLVVSVAGCLTGLLIGLVFNRLSNLGNGKSTLNTAVIAGEADNPHAEVENTDSEAEEEEFGGSSVPYGSISEEPISVYGTPASLALVGAALGPEAVLAVSVLCLLFLLLARFCRLVLTFLPMPPRKLPSTIFVFAATVVLLVFWNSIHDQMTVFFSGVSLWDSASEDLFGGRFA